MIGFLFLHAPIISVHIKNYFETFDACEGGVVKLDNGYELNILGKGRIQTKLQDDIVKTLGDVMYVPALGKNLVSLGRWIIWISAMLQEVELLRVTRGSFVIMKAEKTSNKYVQVEWRFK